MTRTKLSRRIIIIAISVIAGCVVLFFAGRIIAFKKINSAILAEADSLRAKGYTVSFDSLTTNAFSGNVSLANLVVELPKTDLPCGDSANRTSVRRVRIEGVELLPFLLKKKIKISRIRIDHPSIALASTHSQVKKKSHAPRKVAAISVGELEIVSAELIQYDSGSCAPDRVVKFDLTVSAVSLLNPGSDDQEALLDRIVLDRVRIMEPKTFYTISLKHLEWNVASATLDLDSLLLTPGFDKLLFAQKTGHQTDRVTCTIPAIRMTGTEIVLSHSIAVHIRKIETGFDLRVFHDKRYPDGKPKIKYLPARMIAQIPFNLQIDSLLLQQSDIVYEEFPAGGEKAGMVSFNKLSASIFNLSSRGSEAVTMVANARFMNAGDLNARFSVPSDPLKPYEIHGSVSNFSLPEINKILIPIANAEIKSGHLRELKFDFTYNEFRSDGELTMNYSDLSVVSLLKNRKDKQTNKFLTMILNAFVIKKNMDQEKSQGKILFFHDPHRSTFNYWWKSILSGIKSLFGLDKITDTAHSKKK